MNETAGPVGSHEEPLSRAGLRDALGLGIDLAVGVVDRFAITADGGGR